MATTDASRPESDCETLRLARALYRVPLAITGDAMQADDLIRSAMFTAHYGIGMGYKDRAGVLGAEPAA